MAGGPGDICRQMYIFTVGIWIMMIWRRKHPNIGLLEVRYSDNPLFRCLVSISYLASESGRSVCYSDQHSNNRLKYSGDLKFDHSKSWNIWNPYCLKIIFQMVWFSNGWALDMAIAIVPTIQNLDFEWFLKKWRPLVQISNVCASGFQIPFEIWTICNLPFLTIQNPD